MLKIAQCNSDVVAHWVRRNWPSFIFQISVFTYEFLYSLEKCYGYYKIDYHNRLKILYNLPTMCVWTPIIKSLASSLNACENDKSCFQEIINL